MRRPTRGTDEAGRPPLVADVVGCSAATAASNPLIVVRCEGAPAPTPTLRRSNGTNQLDQDALMTQRPVPLHEPLGLQVSECPANGRSAPPEALSGSALVQAYQRAASSGQSVEETEKGLAVCWGSAAGGC